MRHALSHLIMRQKKCNQTVLIAKILTAFQKPLLISTSLQKFLHMTKILYYLIQILKETSNDACADAPLKSNMASGPPSVFLQSALSDYISSDALSNATKHVASSEARLKSRVASGTPSVFLFQLSNI